MSSSRHPETDGLTERVYNTFQRLLRCFCCYDGSNWTALLPQVEFAYNASRALGIEHTPFEANFGFSLEEPLDLVFSMRPSIPVPQDATERLRLLHEVYTMVCSVLHLHKDEVQARTQPSTTPHFVKGDKVSVVTTNQIEIEIENFTTCTVCAVFTPKAVCAGCYLWALPTMPYRELTSQG
jgi:hypothetical protein